MLFLAWLSGFNVGFHSDEIDMNNYGKANYAYYLSGGKDMSFTGSNVYGAEVDPLLKYYGNAFELIAVGVNKMTGLDKGKNEFNSRHAINQLFGIIAILFAGLTARKLSGWKTAVTTIWLLFLTPSFFGNILFNTKDIPFCTGYIATLYFIILLLDELPTVSWKTAIGLMLSFAFATNTRIGGLMLIFYLFAFLGVYLLTNKALFTATLKKVKPLFIKLGTIVFGGIALVIITWPYLLSSPIANLMFAIGVSKKFPFRVNINFEGHPTDSLHVPPHYIFKYILITIPIVILIVLMAGGIFYLLRIKQNSWKPGALLILSVCFPLLYAVLTKMALYSGWRHLLFIYPAICIISSIGLTGVIDLIKKPALQFCVYTLMLAGLFRPLVWCIKNHPYEYTYFNELAGGFKGAFYNYDTDYWEISIQNGLEKLIKQEHLADKSDTVILATNAAAFTRYYISRHYPSAKIRVKSSGSGARNVVPWSYALFNSVFLRPDYLNHYFPPAHYICSEDIDGIPVTFALKDTLRLDLIATNALMAHNYRLADSLFMEHIRKTGDDHPGLYGSMSIAKSSISQNEQAIRYATNGLQYHISKLSDYNCHCGLGIAYANLGQYKMSIEEFKKAQRILPNETSATHLLNQLYILLKNMKAQK